MAKDARRQDVLSEVYCMVLGRVFRAISAFFYIIHRGTSILNVKLLVSGVQYQ